MLKKISSFFSKKNQTKIIILFGIFWILLQIIMTVKPFGLEQINAISPGTKILELQFNYSQENAHRTLGQLGEVGREAYFNFILIDFIFIIFCAGFFTFCIRALAFFFKIDKKIIGKVWLLPLICGFLDIFENIFNLVQIASYPDVTFSIYTISNIITMCKYVIALSYDGITVIGFVIFLTIILKNKITKSNKNLVRCAQENECA